MDRRDAEKLRQHRVALVETIEARKLTDFMIEKGILVSDDAEIIDSKTTRAERARTLVDIIPTRGPRAYEVFIAALSKDYSWLADELRQA